MRADSNLRRLRSEDAAALMFLRREALETDPLVFGSSPADDRFRSLEFVCSTLADHQEQAVFGHFDGNSLSGMVGVSRAAGVKERHKAHMWGMYVAPHARGKGVGRELLRTAVEHARAWSGVDQLQLSVTESAVAAKLLYEAAGFRCWGREPNALAWEGRGVDEFHLVLELPQPPLSDDWKAEIQQRSAEFDANGGETVAWEQIRTDALKRVEANHTH